MKEPSRGWGGGQCDLLKCKCAVKHSGSGSGKTSALVRLIQHHSSVFRIPLRHVVIVYSVWGPALSQLTTQPPKNVKIHFTHHAPTPESLARIVDRNLTRGTILVAFEDIQTYASEDLKVVLKYFTAYANNLGIPTFATVQNTIAVPRKDIITQIKRNANCYLLTESAGNRTELRQLAKVLLPDNKSTVFERMLAAQHEQTAHNTYPTLLVNIHPNIHRDRHTPIAIASVPEFNAKNGTQKGYFYCATGEKRGNVAQHTGVESIQNSGHAVKPHWKGPDDEFTDG